MNDPAVATTCHPFVRPFKPQVEKHVTYWTKDYHDGKLGELAKKFDENIIAATRRVTREQLVALATLVCAVNKIKCSNRDIEVVQRLVNYFISSENLPDRNITTNGATVCNMIESMYIRHTLKAYPLAMVHNAAGLSRELDALSEEAARKALEEDE